MCTSKSFVFSGRFLVTGETQRRRDAEDVAEKTHGSMALRTGGGAARTRGWRAEEAEARLGCRHAAVRNVSGRNHLQRRRSDGMGASLLPLRANSGILAKLRASSDYSWSSLRRSLRLGGSAVKVPFRS